MQRLLSAFFTAVLILLCAPGAGDHPDFSGTWSMDPARSESAHQAVPIGSVTLIIRQTPAELTIETRRSGSKKSPSFTETLTYKLDGSERTAPGNAGVPVRTWAHWDGEKFVAETARQVQGSSITTMHVFSLDASGRELTLDKTLSVQHGYQGQGAKSTGTGKDVFIRAKSAAKK